MQAVILAAGKGTRMGSLSEEIPKPLLNYNGKNLLQHKIDEMPDNIEEIIIVIGHLGEKIKKIFGNSYNNKKIKYILDKEIKGTGLALWQTKEILNENFLVMMGDDLYSRDALINASKENWSVTVKKVERTDESGRVEIDKNGDLFGFLTASKYREKYNDDGLAFTGLCNLNKKIFDYPLVKMKTKDEWGLPQTLLQLIPNIKIKILETDFWIQITTPEDLKK